MDLLSSFTAVLGILGLTLLTLFVVPSRRAALEVYLVMNAYPVFQIYILLTRPLKCLRSVPVKNLALQCLGLLILITLAATILCACTSIYASLGLHTTFANTDEDATTPSSEAVAMDKILRQISNIADSMNFLEPNTDKVLKEINSIANSMNALEPKTDETLQQINHIARSQDHKIEMILEQINSQWYTFLALFVLLHAYLVFVLKNIHKQVVGKTEELSNQMEAVQEVCQDEMHEISQKMKSYRANHPSSDSDEGLCVTCLDRKKNCVFLPCRHLCSCETCAPKVYSLWSRINKCPVCRATVSEVLRVYP